MTGRAWPGRGTAELARLRLGQRDDLRDGRRLHTLGCTTSRPSASSTWAIGTKSLTGSNGSDFIRCTLTACMMLLIRIVAIVRRLGHRVRADVAAGAGAVLDHDRLAPRVGELLADQAREGVGDTADGECADDADRPVRIGRRLGQCGCCGQRLAPATFAARRAVSVSWAGCPQRFSQLFALSMLS